MTLLTDHQIEDLALIVVEDFGNGLSDDELSEQVASLLEHVAGFETASDLTVDRIISQIKRHYNGI